MKLSLESLVAGVDRGWKSMRTACGLRSCQTTLLMRSVPQSRGGIRMGELWYCSVDCFVMAARERFSSLPARRTLEMPHNPRLSVGLAMLSKGYLSDEQFRFASAESQMTGEELESVLVRLGWADEWQLASARAAQWGYPVLGRDRISQSVDADIPITLLRSFSAVPLHYSIHARRLLLGVVYRVEHALLHSIEQVTGCRAEPCFITPTEFRYQMERVTAAQDRREVVLDDSLTPAEMAKTLGGFALEVVARDASLTHCQNYLWTRLSGKRRSIDVLFQSRRSVEINKRADLWSSAEEIRSAG